MVWYGSKVISIGLQDKVSHGIIKRSGFVFYKKAGEFRAFHRKLSAIHHFPFDRTRPSLLKKLPRSQAKTSKPVTRPRSPKKKTRVIQAGTAENSSSEKACRWASHAEGVGQSLSRVNLSSSIEVCVVLMVGRRERYSNAAV